MGCCNSKVEDDDEAYLIATKYDHANGINCICTSEDRSVIVTGSEDKTLRVWSLTDYCECIGICVGHEDYVNCVAMQEAVIVSGSADKTIRLWDAATCQELVCLRGHNSLINRLIISDEYILSSSYDRTIRLWNFSNGDFIREFKGHTRGVYPMILICNDSGAPTMNGGLATRPGTGRSVNFVGPTPANKSILISGSADFTAKLWGLESGRCLFTFRGHQGAITCMGTDPSAKFLVTGSTDSTLRSWLVATGEALHVFEGHKGAIICMNISGKIIYSGSSDHTVRAWVIDAGGNFTRIYKGHNHTVSSVKAVKGLLFTSCGDGIARSYDAKTGALRRTFKGHCSNINAFQVIGSRLYTVSHDTTLRIWDLSYLQADPISVKAANNATRSGASSRAKVLPEKQPIENNGGTDLTNGNVSNGNISNGHLSNGNVGSKIQVNQNETEGENNLNDDIAIKKEQDE